MRSVTTEKGYVEFSFASSEPMQLKRTDTTPETTMYKVLPARDGWAVAVSADSQNTAQRLGANSGLGTHGVQQSSMAISVLLRQCLDRSVHYRGSSSFAMFFHTSSTLQLCWRQSA